MYRRDEPAQDQDTARDMSVCADPINSDHVTAPSQATTLFHASPRRGRRLRQLCRGIRAVRIRMNNSAPN
jgi:hypothetical protein